MKDPIEINIDYKKSHKFSGCIIKINVYNQRLSE